MKHTRIRLGFDLIERRILAELFCFFLFLLNAKNHSILRTLYWYCRPAIWREFFSTMVKDCYNKSLYLCNFSQHIGSMFVYLYMHPCQINYQCTSCHMTRCAVETESLQSRCNMCTSHCVRADNCLKSIYPAQFLRVLLRTWSWEICKYSETRQLHAFCLFWRFLVKGTGIFFARCALPLNYQHAACCRLLDGNQLSGTIPGNIGANILQDM